eukprot:m.4310 g.4310  ORF g.4310 m.4310 type:complete len:54 (+) comp3856_c0_seq1:32-193(+)
MSHHFFSFLFNQPTFSTSNKRNDINAQQVGVWLEPCQADDWREVWKGGEDGIR